MSELKYKVGDCVRIKDTPIPIEGTIENIIRGQLIVNYKGSKIPYWPEDVVLMKSVEEEIPKKDTIVTEDFTYEEKIETILSILATPIWRRRLNDDMLNKLITEAYFEMKERKAKMEE